MNICRNFVGDSCDIRNDRIRERNRDGDGWCECCNVNDESSSLSFASFTIYVMHRVHP